MSNMFSTKTIKEIRANSGKSQKEVAELLQTGRSSYAMWESNNNIFPIRRLIKFCEIYNVSLDYVLELSQKKYKILTNYDAKKSSQRLRELRKEYNITQKNISDFLHIDQPTWSIYESGKSIIGTPFLYMICKKYEISADYLLGRIDTPKYLK